MPTTSSKAKDYKKECQKLITTLEKKPYFSAALPAYNAKINTLKNAHITQGTTPDAAQKLAEQEILSNLHDVLRDAQSLVESHITQRINNGEISNADQARKSAAGNIFQQFVAYCLAKNVLNGSINVPVIITLSVKQIIDKYAAITVDNEIQKPDSDVIVYSEKKDTPILNFSCKTSCRERAGQTYKWKLLCDLATCKCSHKTGNSQCPATRYKLGYTPSKDIKMCFVTTDLYDELNNPQISGMFGFFDKAYVAKTQSPNNGIIIFQEVIQYINSIF